MDETDEAKRKIESVRATRPGSYMFKIQSFSLLSDFCSEYDCLGSPEFESGGRKWRLIIYPSGDSNLEVDDYISMYLFAEDEYIDSVGFEINCTIKMFVYDHLRCNFLTIQDTEVKRFHRYNRKLGFSHLISLEEFKDSTNGYLVNDVCIFGVEIFVIPNIVQEGCLSVVQEPKDGTFTWKLDNFSTLGKCVNFSENFHIQGQKWTLTIFMNESANKRGPWLVMYLELVPHSLDRTGDYMVYAEGFLRLRNNLKDKHLEFSIANWFDDSRNGWGSYRHSILLDDLKNKLKGFNLDDSLTFEVQLNFISKTCSI